MNKIKAGYILSGFPLLLTFALAFGSLPKGLISWLGYLLVQSGCTALAQAIFHPMGVENKIRFRTISYWAIGTAIGKYLIDLGELKLTNLGNLEIQWFYCAIFIGIIVGILNPDRRMERVRRFSHLNKALEHLDFVLNERQLTVDESITTAALKLILMSSTSPKLKNNWNNLDLLKKKVIVTINKEWNPSPDSWTSEVYKMCNGDINQLIDSIDWMKFEKLWDECKEAIDLS